ncbi:sigma-70 family RNA polymerase sigma factor [Arthrobacter sp. ISL-48]|uniref:RNA polymerase sigma factor n=1 Tax=Arthrobacter sp. ISL-48 TaxID=2819110 RepID=UPI001BE7CDC9|nr:sigma-70 family RNA polymerase sigma factor [Arthrobacter sp. ISL-48]MBT2533575.1 sigma-70 family RNA polymerase sigma factor [Arthrobacter sp. ISL-48]
MGIGGGIHLETLEHASPWEGHARGAAGAEPTTDIPGGGEKAAARESNGILAPEGPLGLESDLIAGVRSGDPESMAILYERYREPGLRFIRGLMSGAQESEDVLHDGFAKAVRAIRNGYGPTDMFGPYLNTALRSVVSTFWNRRGREQPAPDEDLHKGQEDDQGLERVLSVFEHEHVAAAMRSLPERWRTVLWYTEVMGEKPRTIAPMLGIEANAVSALLIRARAGLRAAFELQSATPPRPGTDAD